MPGGTVFTCECPDTNSAGTVITFPDTGDRTYPHDGDQELVAECVAQDKYKVTLEDQDHPGPFAVQSGVDVTCTSV